MDFVALGDAFSFVEIQRLSHEEIQRAIHARATTWTAEFDEDRELYGSRARLLEMYPTAGNHERQPRTRGVRDEWDGAHAAVEYDYPVLALTRLTVSAVLRLVAPVCGEMCPRMCPSVGSGCSASQIWLYFGQNAI